MKCDELKPLVFSLNDLAYIDESAVKKNFENPHDHAVYKATEVDAAIEELKQKLEDAEATAYAESVDAGMRERRLKRALWIERAERAKYRVEYWACRGGTLLEHYPFCVNGDSPFNRLSEMGCLYGNTNERLKEAKFKHLYASEWMLVWENVERKCLAKAEEYK